MPTITMVNPRGDSRDATELGAFELLLRRGFAPQAGTVAAARTQFTGQPDTPAALETAKSSSGPYLNVKDFGTKADGRWVTDAATTAGSATVTSATAAFTQADVGKLVTVANSSTGANAGYGTIASVQSATQATMSANATATLTGATLRLASDDTAALQAAVDSLAATGGVVFAPAGIYGVSNPVRIPGAVTLAGAGYEYASTPSATKLPPLRGTIFCAFVNVGAVIVTGKGTQVEFTSGYTSPKLLDVCVDGAALAQNGIKTQDRRSRLERCQAYYCTAVVFWLAGQNTWAVQCVGGNLGSGTVFGLTNNDIKLIDCEGRAGTPVVSVESSGAMIRGGHFYVGNAGTSNDLKISNPAAAAIANVVIEGVTFDAAGGSHLLIQPVAGGAIDGVSITGCTFYQVSGAYSDLGGSMLRVDASNAGSRVSGVTFVGNTGNGVNASTRIGAIATVTGTTVNGITVANNTARFCAAAIGGGAGLVDAGRAGNAISSNGTAWLYSTREGQATLNGTGAQTAFTIAHGLAAAPASAQVVPASAAAAAPFYVTSDATNITVTFTAAPAAGTGNVVLNWRAQV